MKIVTAEQVRQIDQECVHMGMPTNLLMENAGKAVAEETRRSLGALKNQHILCLTGPGNNGGDGLVAARYLYDWGAKVSIYLCTGRTEKDLNLSLVRKRKIDVFEVAQDENLRKFDDLLASASCIIDAIFGTGKLRPLEGIIREVLERVTRVKKEKNIYIVAVDLPSGLDADSGAVDPACLYADMTVTLAFPKMGLFSFPGAERVGTLKIVNIGIPEALAAPLTTELITKEWAYSVLPERPLNANKGTFGRVLVVAGSINYIGAAYLACNGATRVGAGLVTLSTPAMLQPILAAKLTEVTYLPLPESGPGSIAPEAAGLIAKQSGQYQVLLLGCGLGQSQSTIECVKALILDKGWPAMVLDADALDMLAEIPDWWQHLSNNAILTPHPGEMARLCGKSIGEVQSDRLGTAREYAGKWHKPVVLKGAYTVIASPDGPCRVSPFANPGLASAGTGDVLAGAIAGLVAQGLSFFDAASLGVYLHGAAGEIVRDTLGDAGTIASDLLPVLPVAIKNMKKHS